MNEAYSAADLVISRAGAASLSEISQFGLPSILIPFPFAAERHQHRNAALFEQAGAAEVLEEAETTPESLVRLITNLLADDRRRERMAEAATALLPAHAAEHIADIMENRLKAKG